MQGFFGQPAALILAPLAVALLYLLERWRRRPAVVVVADLSLFETTPEVEEQAAARRRKLGLQWLLRAASAVLLTLAVAGLRWPFAATGPVRVDLVLDRGISSGARAGEGTRLDAHKGHLLAVLDALEPDDRVRLHLTPPSGSPATLDPAAARAALAEVKPTAAHADVERTAAGLAAVSAAPVFVATDRPLEGAGVAVATCADAFSNRGIVALARDEQGTVHVTLDSHDASGSATVVVSALAGEEVLTRELRAELPARGSVRVSVADLPAHVREASARLEASDGLATDDRAFAVLPPAPTRRVGLLGDPGPDVTRALRAVRGVRLERLDAWPPAATQRDLDLLVAPRLPPAAEPSTTALLVIPRRAGEGAGGRLRASTPSAAFPYTRASLAREPEARAAKLPALPSGLKSFETLLEAGEEPYLLVAGTGRTTVAVVRGPLTREATNWPLQRSFPLFFAELLELAAPRAAARLEAHPAGRPWSGEPPLDAPPLQVGRVRAPGGELLLGTVAAPVTPAPAAARQPFAADALAAIDDARPQAPPTTLAPLLAALALLAAGAGWWLGRT